MERHETESGGDKASVSPKPVPQVRTAHVVARGSSSILPTPARPAPPRPPIEARPTCKLESSELRGLIARQRSKALTDLNTTIEVLELEMPSAPVAAAVAPRLAHTLRRTPKRGVEQLAPLTDPQSEPVLAAGSAPAMAACPAILDDMHATGPLPIMTVTLREDLDSPAAVPSVVVAEPALFDLPLPVAEMQAAPPRPETPSRTRDLVLGLAIGGTILAAAIAAISLA